MTFLEDAQADLKMILESEFSEPVIFIRSGSSEEIELEGVFHETFEEVVSNDGAISNALSPRLLCMINELDPIPRNNDKFEIRNKRYAITKVEPNSRGNAVIYLKVAPTR